MGMNRMAPPTRSADVATYQVLDALDEWFGRHAGWFHMETSDIIEQSRLMLGDTIDEYRSSFQKTMVKSISEPSSNQRKGKQIKLASGIVQTLFARGFGWKLELGSREEFRERMKAAIKICCQNL
jgi:TetR/AcrR family transcriptional regulator of autoinduction and epiphytic fitness